VRRYRRKTRLRNKIGLDAVRKLIQRTGRNRTFAELTAVYVGIIFRHFDACRVWYCQLTNDKVSLQHTLLKRNREETAYRSKLGPRKGKPRELTATQRAGNVRAMPLELPQTRRIMLRGPAKLAAPFEVHTSLYWLHDLFEERLLGSSVAESRPPTEYAGES
jgi:hypothetical protein